MFRFQPKTRLNVQTKSGAILGRVHAVEIDEATGRIAQFFVLSNHMLPRLFDRELIVSWNQVVGWHADVLVVADAVVPVEIRNIVFAPTPETGTHLSDTSAQA